MRKRVKKNGLEGGQERSLGNPAGSGRATRQQDPPTDPKNLRRGGVPISAKEEMSEAKGCIISHSQQST